MRRGAIGPKAGQRTHDKGNQEQGAGAGNERDGQRCLLVQPLRDRGHAGQAEEGQRGDDGAEGQHAGEPAVVAVSVLVLVVAVVRVAGVVAEIVRCVGLEIVAADLVMAEAEQTKQELADQQRAADDRADEKDGFHECTSNGVRAVARRDHPGIGNLPIMVRRRQPVNSFPMAALT